MQIEKKQPAFVGKEKQGRGDSQIIGPILRYCVGYCSLISAVGVSY